MSGQGFPVNEGEANQLQNTLGQMLLEFIKEWRRQNEKPDNVEKNKKEDLKPELPELEVWQKGQMIVGNNNDGQFINNLDPKTEFQLKVAKELPIGSKVEGLEDFSVIVRTGPRLNKVEELFKTDEQGIITKNVYKNNVASKTQNNGVPDKTLLEGVESVSGLDRLKEKLSKGKTPEIMLLSQQVTDLKQQLQQQKTINENQQKMNQMFLERLKLQEARMSAPRDPNWWQKGIDKFKELKMIYLQHRAQQRAAKIISQFWNKENTKDASIYQGTNYTINKEKIIGNDYFKLINKKTAEVVIKFTRTKLGVVVYDSNLNPQNLKDIDQLKQSMKNNQIDSNFSSLDTKLKYRNTQIQNIADTFVDVARQQPNGNLNKKGHYFDVSANADGEVKIWRKEDDVPKLIYNQSEKGQFNQMSEKDVSLITKALKGFKEQKLLRENPQQITPESVIKNLPTMSRRGR
jgi:hypothetical protein